MTRRIRSSKTAVATTRHSAVIADENKKDSTMNETPTVEMRFVNSDATPKTVNIMCDRASCRPIAAWYGSYYAGDRYSISIDGVKAPKDQNGELIGWQP